MSLLDVFKSMTTRKNARIRERIEGDGRATFPRSRKSRRSAVKRPGSAAKSRVSRPARTRRPHRRGGISGVGIFRLVALLLVVVLGAGAFGFAWQRRSKASEENKARLAKIDKGPMVETTKVKAAPAQQKLTLQGECRPYFEATVFAKVSGYLKTIRVYEGDVVHQGDVLATISSPETDQALVSARADAGNKKRVAERYQILLNKQLASPQEAEQAFADHHMAQARLSSALEARNYETLRAPFDGMVTARFVDPGALIPDASNSRAAQLAILTVADMRKLKIDAYVDQRFASQIRVGQAVEIHLPNQTDQKYAGQLARLSGSLDPRTRMLFVEIDFDNLDRRIVSGSFLNIDLILERQPLVSVPVNALVQVGGKAALAVVGNDHKIQMSSIEVVENDGTNLLISRGVKAGQIVALNVGTELKNGSAVQFREAPATETGAAKPNGAPNSQPDAATGSTQKLSDQPNKGKTDAASLEPAGAHHDVPAQDRNVR